MRNRELDAWLAEHAMGWKRWQMEVHPKLGCCLFPPECNFTSNWILALADTPFNLHTCFGPPYQPFEPSTDPFASDALLDRMVELGWEYSTNCRRSIFLGKVIHKVQFTRVGCTEVYVETADKRECIALAAKASLEYPR